MNALYVGLSKKVEFPSSGFLFIDDQIPHIPDWKRPKISIRSSTDSILSKTLTTGKLAKSRTFCTRSTPKEKTRSR